MNSSCVEPRYQEAISTAIRHDNAREIDGGFGERCYYVGVFRDRSLSRARLIQASKFDGVYIVLRQRQSFSILSCSAIFHRDGGLIEPINRFHEFPMLEAQRIRREISSS